MQTLCDNRLVAPLSIHAFLGIHHGSCVSSSYSMDMEESLLVDEAMKSENWLVAMQYAAIIRNETWSLCDLTIVKKSIGTK